MCENISVTESTVRSLQIIFAYQGQQLIKKIGKKKGWTDEETESLIKEFINKKNLEIKFLPDNYKKRGSKKLDLDKNERCIALTANGEQCSRRKNKSDKSIIDFCGIHLRKAKSSDGLSFGTIVNKRNNIDDKSNSDNSINEIDTDIDIDISSIIESKNSFQQIKNNINKKCSYQDTSQEDTSDIEESCFYPLGENVSDSDSDSFEDITVSDIMINGVKYMIDNNTNNVYSYENDIFIGKYDRDQNKIIN